MRTIDRLRYEFGVPIEYEEIRRGYYLTRNDFSFAILPPSREELMALCIVADLAQLMGDISVCKAIEALWTRVATGRSDVERSRVRERLLVEPEVLASLSGVNLLYLLVMCQQDNLLRVQYKSPWMHGNGVEYIGRFERVRANKGRLHVVCICADGSRVVLDSAFIQDMGVLSGDISHSLSSCPVACPDEAWYSGDGGWSGANTEVVEVTISAPASRYYGTQVWCRDQRDSWEGETLVRTFSSVVSVELAARLLSLGRAVVSIRPASILERLRTDVANLGRLYVDLES